MNCKECLAALAESSVIEIHQNGSVREHSATCPECARVATLVMGAERDLAFAFNSIVSQVPATRTAEAAVTIEKRRRAGWLVSVAAALALVVVLWVVWIRVLVPGARATAELATINQHTMTAGLDCLTSQQAGDLISPYVRSNGSVWYASKPPMKVITVRGTAEELKKVRELLQRFDNSTHAECTRDR